jgi:hypothetical protein
VACTGPILRSSIGRDAVDPDSLELIDGELIAPPYFVRKVS